MYYIVIYLIFIIKFIISENNSGANPVLLNISRRRPPNINVLRQSCYSIDTLVYTAVDGYISEVIDDRGFIWKAPNGILKFTKVTKFRNDSKLLHIYYVYNSGKSDSKYYYRTGRVWDEITEGRFYDEFDDHRTKFFSDSITLYLNGKNQGKHASINKPEGSNFAAYSPSYGYQINKVCDYNLWVFCFKSVWTPRDNDHCLFASVHNQKKPDLAYLIISNKGKIEEKFYHKTDGVFKKWVQVDREDYIEKVKSKGFDPVEFDNSVELNLENVDSTKFYSSKYGYNYSTTATYPKPGFRIKKVVFGESVIWEPKSANTYCHYANLFSGDDGPRSCYLLVNEGRDRRVEYYVNTENGWKKTEKTEFYNLLANKEKEPRYTHLDLGLDENGNRKLETSLFKNRQGLVVRTYRSLVPNHKGVVVVVHGIRVHFLEFGLNPNIDWNYRNFGFATHPYIICPDPQVFYDFRDLNVSRYKHIFEYNVYDNVHSYDKLPLFEYSGGMIECLNNMGFSVYGMDLQSHGYSEGIDSLRSHVLRIYNYTDDIIQYVHIIKRDKFLDRDQVYNEKLFSQKTSFEDKIVLMGFSLSGNLCTRSIMEYYKNYKSGEKLIDGLALVSGMFDLSNNMGKTMTSFLMFLSGILSAIAPRGFNSYHSLPNYSQRYNFSIFLNDDKYTRQQITWRTTRIILQACYDVRKNIDYYPKDMISLIIHSTDDFRCSIKGVKKFVEKLGSKAVMVELPGNDHHTYKTQFLPILSEHIGGLFNRILADSSVNPQSA